ncbi:MAG: nitroreductase family protein [Anaerolineaceae bacterium]|nr:nitroreductase family protein [Anaerolineaceae bacterium]
MEFFEVIDKRRTIRKYTGEGISKETLLKIVDAGRKAASGQNRQPWEFVLITNPDTIKMIASEMNRWLENASAIIAVVMDKTAHFHLQDGSAAIENMLLAATALGYGSCWLEGTTAGIEGKLKKHLGIPKKLHLQSLVSIGVPVEWTHKEKRPLEEVVHWEQF